MAHERKLIRDAVVAALTGETVAGTRVKSTREAPATTDELPCITVYTLEEPVQEGKSAPRELKRNLVVAVDGWVESVEQDDTDDLMDDLALEIETAMDADVYISNTASDSWLTFTEMKISRSGERTIGVVHMEYLVEYRTEQRIAEATDEFDEVDLSISLEGVQASDDQRKRLKTGINQEP